MAFADEICKSQLILNPNKLRKSYISSKSLSFPFYPSQAYERRHRGRGKGKGLAKGALQSHVVLWSSKAQTETVTLEYKGVHNKTDPLRMSTTSPLY